MKRLFNVVALVVIMAPCAPAEETIEINAGDSTVRFRDNSASPKILSGAQSLVNRRDAAESPSRMLFPTHRIL